jgi:hypothetical protein
MGIYVDTRTVTILPGGNIAEGGGPPHADPPILPPTWKCGKCGTVYDSMPEQRQV